LALAVSAGAAPSHAQTLADRYAPIVALKVATSPPCDTGGEQYDPSAVEIVLDRPQIVLQGPAPRRGAERPETRGPTAADLYGKGADWNLDFPGSPFEPGCTYARDASGIGQGMPPVAYAHIVA